MSCADRPRKDEARNIKLVRALQKDFTSLYTKGFTTSWKTQRWIRNIELGIMRLENTEKLLEKAKTEAKIEVLEGVMGDWDNDNVGDYPDYGRAGASMLKNELREYLKEMLSNLKKRKK